jgi:hypothetical protein
MLRLVQGGELSTFIRTLVGAGFTITNTTTKPNYFVAHASRSDEFGIASKYVFGYGTARLLSAADCATLSKLARESNASLVVAGETMATPVEGAFVITKEDLLAKLGGPVASLLPFEPEYSAQLCTLAKNQLPADMVGKADDLFEKYVHAGLQFLLRGRVLRYGQERRFEALADGVVLNSSAALMLYDCKAADPTYEITRNTIRQFADYTKDFRARYGRYLEEPHAFLVVAPEFQDDAAVLQNRSNELYAACRIPLVCMRANTLGSCVSLCVDHLLYRMAIDWKKVFSPPLVKVQSLKQQLTARIKDGVIRP